MFWLKFNKTCFLIVLYTEHVSFHAFCDVISGLPGRYGAYTPLYRTCSPISKLKADLQTRIRAGSGDLNR